jgi:hypothetical protein
MALAVAISGDISNEATTSAVGTPRHCAVKQNMILSGALADIDQATPIKLDL